MKKKIIWVVISGLMALSLVMASCGPAEEEAEVEVGEEEVEVGEVEVTEEEEEEEVEEVTTGPQYGGTIKIATPFEPRRFDESHGWTTDAITMKLTHQAKVR